MTGVAFFLGLIWAQAMNGETVCGTLQVDVQGHNTAFSLAVQESNGQVETWELRDRNNGTKLIALEPGAYVCLNGEDAVVEDRPVLYVRKVVSAE